MTESLMGFTLGVLIVALASLAWKGQRMLREWHRSVEQRIEALEDGDEQYERRIGVIAEKVSLMREVISTGNGAGAADAALAQLATRLTQLEKAHAAQDLTILETAEKVAHKLQDRRRKRDQAEVGEIDEAPHDPAQLLAEARRAYGVTSPDPAQLQLIGEAS